jgi:transcriptional regulator with XRE-family HTH domain
MARRGRPLKPLDRDSSVAAWLGAEIRARRLQRGLTLAALARLAGYSAQHVSEVERATAPVSGSFVAAVDRALDARGQLLVLLPAVIYERAVGRHERDAARRRDAPVADPRLTTAKRGTGRRRRGRPERMRM